MPYWSVPIPAASAAPPVADVDRVYLALRSAHVVALRSTDGQQELWRVAREVTVPMAAADGLLFIGTGDAIEALRGADGATAWIAPRVKAVTSLVATPGLLLAVTADEIVAIHAADGQVAWRRAAGGVRHPPAVDGTRVFVGADDGRVAALGVTSGEVHWEQYVNGGVTALRASRGLVYAGGGDKKLHCLDARNGREKWTFASGLSPTGAIAVDDKRVYFSALDNVVRGLDRETGNLRWQTALNRRPVAGVRLAGHVLFVEVTSAELVMLFDATGLRSGVIALPKETTRDLPIDVRETEAGVHVFVVTGNLAGEWNLTMIGPAGEAPLEPFDKLTPLPGVAFLTDPALAPIGLVLPWLILTDPALQPFSAIEWPVVLRDPPLVPLTTLPGIQLRPLSPVLPAHRGG